MRSDFLSALKSNQGSFGLSVAETRVEKLADYYEIVLEHNPLLHLVAPCSAEEFAVRHVLESLTLLEFLPCNAKIADVGTGGGLPSIPCLIVRDDLKAALIESKEKKVRFLETAIERLDLANRAAVINRQFEEADPADSEFVVCRALDKFTEKLPRLVKWSGKRIKLFFGGNNLKEALEKQKLQFDAKLMPLSEQRFLFIVKK